MLITPLYLLLVVLLFVIAIVSFANALVVEAHRITRYLTILFSVGIMGMALYYVGAGVELLDTANPLARDVFRLCLIVALSALVPVFGVPVLLHLTRRGRKTK